jgi:hypothetical protein
MKDKEAKNVKINYRVDEVGALIMGQANQRAKDFAFLGGMDTRTQSEIYAENVNKEKYSAYFKDVSRIDFIDVYQVHNLFNVDDPSGAIQHASKKLLLSGVRTGGKSKADDIREARDTLNRWLEIN